MNEDLRWLAENVTEWHRNAEDKDSIRRDTHGWSYTNEAHCNVKSFTREEWQAARDQLEDERMGIVARNGNDGLHYPEQSGKQSRYQDSNGEDWIDEFARTATPEEFRGAMRFTLGKYVRRAGKKDALESEIEKIRDYAARWLEVEKRR